MMPDWLAQVLPVTLLVVFVIALFSQVDRPRDHEIEDGVAEHRKFLRDLREVCDHYSQY